MVPVFWSGLFPAPGTQLHKAELAGVLVAVQPVEEQHRARADAAVAVVDQQGDAELRAVLQLEAEPLRRNRGPFFYFPEKFSPPQNGEFFESQKEEHFHFSKNSP